MDVTSTGSKTTLRRLRGVIHRKTASPAEGKRSQYSLCVSVSRSSAAAAHFQESRYSDIRFKRFFFLLFRRRSVHHNVCSHFNHEKKKRNPPPSLRVNDNFRHFSYYITGAWDITPRWEFDRYYFKRILKLPLKTNYMARAPCEIFVVFFFLSCDVYETNNSVCFWRLFRIQQQFYYAPVHVHIAAATRKRKYYFSKAVLTTSRGEFSRRTEKRFKRPCNNYTLKLTDETRRLFRKRKTKTVLAIIFNFWYSFVRRNTMSLKVHVVRRHWRTFPFAFR